MHFSLHRPRGGARPGARTLTVGITSFGLVALLLLGTAGAVLAHQVTRISGTVDCSGNYSISVTGDVYGGVHLVVTLGGTTIYDQAENGSSSVQTFGPFTGTGATAGEAIAAYPSDGGTSAGATGTLVAQPEVCKTTPAITTTTGGSVVLGSGTPLTDTATLSDGNSPTGTITFTLTSPSGTVVDTETATVDGNGNYATPTGYVPTVTGTFHWVASYGGDGNNVGVASGLTDEPVVVEAASPSIATTPNPGSGRLNAVHLNDSAVLSGGYNPTGTITFNLYPPTVSGCDGEAAFNYVATVSGDGTYATSGGPIANALGTWHWTADYSGDSNNNPVSSGCQAEPVVITSPPPPDQGFFYFTKTVGGDLTGWSGGTFSFTVTCGSQTSHVDLAFGASGGSQDSQAFGPYAPGTVCTVSEGALPGAGANASWVNSPTYTPGASATIVRNENVSVTVTNTRSVTPPSTPTPTPTTPATPTPAVPTPTPAQPSSGVLGTTGTPAPTLPPTSSLAGTTGSSGNTPWLLVAGLLGLSAALVAGTRLQVRFTERRDRD